MRKLRRSADAVRSAWESHVKPRVSTKRASQAARRLVYRLTEEERLAILGMLTGLLLKRISLADPRARLLLLVLLVIVSELLSSYLELDSGLTASAPA